MKKVLSSPPYNIYYILSSYPNTQLSLSAEEIIIRGLKDIQTYQIDNLIFEKPKKVKEFLKTMDKWGLGAPESELTLLLQKFIDRVRNSNLLFL